jgi:iduronate 2-sulfatase
MRLHFSPVLFFCLSALSLGAAEPLRKPNVLFIAVDDLNNHLGCYGNSIVKSPHIDRLAARGMRFDRAYCQYPLCNPTRSSLLTGRRPDTTRVYENQTYFRTALPDVQTLPQILKAHGYTTARTGKIFHGGIDDAASWDIGGQKFNPDRPRPPRPAPGQPNPADRWEAVDQTDDQLPDGKTAIRALELLDELKDKPHFLAVGFLKPHVPLIAPRKYFGLYKAEQMPLPTYYQEGGEDLSRVPRAALRPNFDLFRLAQPAPAKAREGIAAYYSCISYTDALVGRLLDRLEQLKLTDKTIVVLWGDHGWHLGEHGLWSKMSLFEESARVPLIISVPGKKAGATTRLAEFVDLYPTIAALCGAKLPDGLEGRSLAPLLDEPRRPWKSAAFTQVRSGNIMGRAVRTERWRYIEWDGGKAGIQLYDHELDPHELKNLAGDPAHADTAARMKKHLLDRWQAALPPAS